MTKTVYQLDEKGYFDKPITLDDSDRSPSGAWNVPARCVETEPPMAKDGYKIKWNGEGWEYEEEPKEEGPTVSAPTFEELKERKIQAVNAWTAGKITGGFTSSASGESVQYGSDKDTQLTMQGIALNVNTEQFAEKYQNGCSVHGVKDGDTEKTIQYLSATQVMQWCADLSIHIGTCKQEGWLKQAEVEACTTKEELDVLY